MPRKRDEKALAALKEALEEGDSRQSALYRWMRENHDDFAELLQGRRPNWEKLTEVFRSLGFSDANANELQARTVRQTWWRVRRRYAADKVSKKPAPKSAAIPVVQVAEPVKPPAPSAPPVPVPPAPAATPASSDPTDPERAKAAKEAFARMVEEMNHRS